MATETFHPGQVAALAHIGGWTGKDQIVTATAVALAESGGRMVQGRKNSDGSTDWGIWQINDKAHPDKIARAKKSPIDNAHVAYEIYVAAGHSFTPWSVYKSGSYKAHLMDAELGWGEIQDNTGIEAALKAGGGAKESDFGNINPGSPIDNTTSAIGGLSGSITNGFNTFTQGLFGITMNVGVLVVAVVLLILGVVILMRGSISSVLPVGKIAKVAGKVGKVT